MHELDPSLGARAARAIGVATVNIPEDIRQGMSMIANTILFSRVNFLGCGYAGQRSAAGIFEKVVEVHDHNIGGQLGSPEHPLAVSTGDGKVVPYDKKLHGEIFVWTEVGGQIPDTDLTHGHDDTCGTVGPCEVAISQEVAVFA
ncbi:hypothetical protein MUP32_01740 [Candidatus Microgenomates bacterium]|nr:hypothetical protein [Candidatus Microgenomates bacterium]